MKCFIYVAATFHVAVKMTESDSSCIFLYIIPLYFLLETIFHCRERKSQQYPQNKWIYLE